MTIVAMVVLVSLAAPPVEKAAAAEPDQSTEVSKFIPVVQPPPPPPPPPPRPRPQTPQIGPPPPGPVEVIAPPPRPRPPERAPSRPPPPPLQGTDQLVRYRRQLTARASTEWTGWVAERAIDGDETTSWFSERRDAAAFGCRPWVEVIFPVDVSLQHVIALGNREPPWEVNYSIVVARVDFLDAEGNVLASQNNESGTPTFDIEFHFKKRVEGVRRVRFTSVNDQGDRNRHEDIGVGEIQAW